ncbi:hypothetical protein Hanom_Chr11g01026401 [Helianthus anomalus]
MFYFRHWFHPTPINFRFVIKQYFIHFEKRNTYVITDKHTFILILTNIINTNYIDNDVCERQSKHTTY